MIEQVKESHQSPAASSRFEELRQQRCDMLVTGIEPAAKMLQMMSQMPARNVASMAGLYEVGVLGAKHPAYEILPSRRLTLRTDRYGLLLVKFELFDPSEQELKELRKATEGALVILDIVGAHGRVRVDDEGLVQLCRGKLNDLFPARDND